MLLRQRELINDSIVGCSAVRIYLYRHMDFMDWTYHTGRIMLFNGPEPALGILAGCLPVLSPCLRLVSNKIKSCVSRTKDSPSPDPRMSTHPPTIGQAKRMSLRAMRIGSVHSDGFDRLGSQTNVVPLVSVSIDGEKNHKVEERHATPRPIVPD